MTNTPSRPEVIAVEYLAQSIAQSARVTPRTTIGIYEGYQVVGIQRINAQMYDLLLIRDFKEIDIRRVSGMTKIELVTLDAPSLWGIDHFHLSYDSLETIRRADIHITLPCTPDPSGHHPDHWEMQFSINLEGVNVFSSTDINAKYHLVVGMPSRLYATSDTIAELQVFVAEVMHLAEHFLMQMKSREEEVTRLYVEERHQWEADNQKRRQRHQYGKELSPEIAKHMQTAFNLTDAQTREVASLIIDACWSNETSFHSRVADRLGPFCNRLIQKGVLIHYEEGEHVIALSPEALRMMPAFPLDLE